MQGKALTKAVYETVDVKALRFDPRNARKHDKKNLDAIKGSLTQFGQQKPIVVSKGDIVIAGNGTLQAARELGWKTIEVIRSDLDETKATAFALADNRTAELAEWDMDELKATLKELDELDFDLASIGFEAPQMEGGTEGLTDPDDVPEVPQNIHGVERGQIWQLGEHRLLCGDSTSKDDVERLMAGEKADMVFTDPPYGMRLDADYGKAHTNSDGRHSVKGKGQRSNSYRPVEGDDRDYNPSHIFEKFDCEEIFLFGADYYCKHLPVNGSWVVWDKRTTKDGDSRFDAAHGSAFELCWSKQRHKREIARILHCGLYSVENDKREHPTQKPVKLAEWFFERWGKPNDLVADLFLGSGSTLIACEKTNRKCFGMEIDPHYCSVIIERWQKFTGKEAKLLGSR